MTSKLYYTIVCLTVFMGTISVLWVADNAIARQSLICQEGYY